MTRTDTTNPSNRKGEVMIAVIGLAGVLGTAVFSNWDKLYPPPNEVKAQYSGYTPTGDPQVELRYFFEVAGMRAQIQGMQAELLTHFRRQLETQFKENPELASELLKVISDEYEGQYDQILNLYIPVASKHFSVAEVQELNKFYSTPPMRELTRRLPLLGKEFMPMVTAMAEKAQERVGPKIQAIVEKHK